MMSSSLPHVTSNHVSYNGLYGLAVFSQKDGSGEFPGGTWVSPSESGVVVVASSTENILPGPRQHPLRYLGVTGPQSQTGLYGVTPLAPLHPLRVTPRGRTP